MKSPFIDISTLRMVFVAALLAFPLALPSLAAAQAPAEGPVTEAEALRALDDAKEALNAPQTQADAREATLALRDLALSIPALEGRDRRRAAAILSRPTDRSDRRYFGPEAPGSPICDPGFCVHWTTKSGNAPKPGFVGEVNGAAKRVQAVENEMLGWPAAKSDGKLGARDGKGRTGQVDIYLTDLGSRLYGYASTDPGQRGNRQFAYLVLDNDYAGFRGDDPAVELMRATLAHEYNHVLQFAQDVRQEAWMFESTATWMEPRVFPEIDDFLNFIPSFAANPDVPLTNPKVKIYGSAVFHHWLSNRYGPDVVREAWKLSRQARPKHQGIAAVEAALDGEKKSRSFSKEFAAFAARTAEWQSSDAFPAASAYPDVARSGNLRAPRRGSRSAGGLRLDNTSYELFDVPIPPNGDVKLKGKVKRGVRSSVALVTRKGSRDSGRVKVVSRYLPKGGKAGVLLPRADRFDRITAVAINADGRTRGGLSDYRSDHSSFSLTLKRR